MCGTLHNFIHLNLCPKNKQKKLVFLFSPPPHILDGTTNLFVQYHTILTFINFLQGKNQLNIASLSPNRLSPKTITIK